ncbi:MAG: hypothetical protein HY908_36525 [Myxococcales bacterium]|nr:hypothetical protein [Myxococcales bacterium]
MELRTRIRRGCRLIVEAGRAFYIGKRTMLCLSYVDGGRLWAAELPTSVGAEPNMLVHAGCVVVMDVGEAASYSMQDGSPWRHPALRRRSTDTVDSRARGPAVRTRSERS